ncbi:IlvD/Edd family dehydratase [Acidothermaceae bacterium B102]|nr:IlvD/Edd family dehydratase [Acidothermaceae bacterium B102]
MTLRSAGWFAAEGKTGIMHRSWLRSEGLPDDSFEGRPIIGIANSWSELTPCNLHLRLLAEHVKRGVWQAGGVPFEFPTTSAGEPLVRPSAMILRNLISMDLEETLRANPLDAVVLLAGCDKTTPAYLMGAASVDLPTIMMTGGPMLNGKYRGTDIGSGTSIWRLTEAFRAGEISQAQLSQAESCMARSSGHCMTMGTASTMACLTEILGLQLPESATLPADDSRRRTLAHLVGRRIVAMVHEDQRMSQVVTRSSFFNAIKANAALGGSTNAVVHLLALAGRLGIPLSLDDFDSIAAAVPTLVNLMPSGEFLMEDFAYAGGMGALVNELGGHLDGTAATVTGLSLEDNYEGAECFNREVIRTIDNPLKPAGTQIAVLHGNLAPNGAVIKQAAASPELLQHVGRARVWDRVEDYLAEADDPDCDIDRYDIIVIRYSGPRGYPGMPEIANVALPKKLLQQGVRDMVRISDARMSGTSYGTVVLHVAPEAAVGGPLALVHDGDIILLDVPARRLELQVDADELERRRAEWEPPEVPGTDRGYLKLYVDHVMGADEGADFDFLRGGSGAAVPRQAF